MVAEICSEVIIAIGAAIDLSDFRASRTVTIAQFSRSFAPEFIVVIGMAEPVYAV